MGRFTEVITRIIKMNKYKMDVAAAARTTYTLWSGWWVICLMLLSPITGVLLPNLRFCCWGIFWELEFWQEKWLLMSFLPKSTKSLCTDRTQTKTLSIDRLFHVWNQYEGKSFHRSILEGINCHWRDLNNEREIVLFMLQKQTQLFGILSTNICMTTIRLCECAQQIETMSFQRSLSCRFFTIRLTSHYTG